MDDRRPARAGAQNPAYRPAHPHKALLPALLRLFDFLVLALLRQNLPEDGIDGPAAEVFSVGEQVSVRAIVSVIVAWPSLAWITFGLRLAAISVEALLICTGS
jgi:hypothetical protein